MQKPIQPYYLQDIGRFQRKFGFEAPPSYTRLSDDLHNFRAAFIEEELAEFIQGCQTNDVPLALDSLIDLVYVIGGAAILHGFDKVEFYEACRDNPSTLFDLEEPRHSRPAILKQANWERSVAYLKQLILAFRGAHTSGSAGEASRYKNLYILTRMWNTCFDTASWMGVSGELWDALWDDVQEANMAKERATRDDQSKRGSAAFDIIKPAGWVGPDTAGVINKFYEDFNNA